jgi:hypothetical protein
LFYVINKHGDPQTEPNSKISVGFVNGEPQFDKRDGGLTVNSVNDGVTFEKFKEVVGETNSVKFLNLMKERIKELGGKHPAQQSTESGKRKADIVIIEEAAKQKTAVVNAKPKNLAWDITLDVKPSENIGSGLVFPTRLTVLYKRLVIENVFFSSTTPTVRQIGNDITPGYSVIKNLHLTVNIVGGINNTTATQIATNKVTRTNKILMGGQIFGKIKRFSFGSPVARFEKIMNGKVLPALVEFFYVDTTPKIKLGHEGFFTKTAQGGFIYNLAVLLQWKPAIAGPAMEIGIFSNHLRMPNGQIVRSLGIRGRGIFKWRF